MQIQIGRVRVRAHWLSTVSWFLSWERARLCSSYHSSSSDPATSILFPRTSIHHSRLPAFKTSCHACKCGAALHGTHTQGQSRVWLAPEGHGESTDPQLASQPRLINRQGESPRLIHTAPPKPRATNTTIHGERMSNTESQWMLSSEQTANNSSLPGWGLRGSKRSEGHRVTCDFQVLTSSGEHLHPFLQSRCGSGGWGPAGNLGTTCSTPAHLTEISRDRWMNYFAQGTQMFRTWISAQTVDRISSFKSHYWG